MSDTGTIHHPIMHLSTFGGQHSGSDSDSGPVQSEPHDPEPYVRLTAALRTTDIPIYPLPPSIWNKNKDQPVNVFCPDPAKNLMATTATEGYQISLIHCIQIITEVF